MLNRSITLLLWLLVIDLGIAFGAGLYEHRIVIPRWLVVASDGTLHWNAEAARLDNSGLRFWAYITTGPLTILTIANLWAAWRYAAGWLRAWWIAASAVSLAERVLTLAFFIPTMIGLMNAPDTPESVATATRWVELNYIRHALALTAWVLALQTFWMSGRAASRALPTHSTE